MLDRNARRRQGVSVLETLIAVALLLVVIPLIAQLSVSMMAHRRSVAVRARKHDAKDSLMQIALALPYQNLDEATLRARAEPIEIGNQVWNVSVVEGPAKLANSTPTDFAQAKRITLSLSHNTTASDTDRRRPLVAWRYPVPVEAEDAP